MTTYIPSITLPAFVFENPAVSILLPIVAGSLVGYSTRPKQTQNTYLALKQPPLRPPPWVFAPAWTALYGFMGYAAYRAWTTGHASISPKTLALARQGATLYTIQLGLNLIWMPLFFGMLKPVSAMVDIVALTGVTSYMTYIWSQVDEIAGYALVPYIGWLGFATYLCAGAGHLNGWSFQDKIKPVPPTTKSKETRFVDEKDE